MGDFLCHRTGIGAGVTLPETLTHPWGSIPGRNTELQFLKNFLNAPFTSGGAKLFICNIGRDLMMGWIFFRSV